MFTWSNAQSKTRRPLNSIILQEGVIESLVEDVKEFLETGTSRLEYLTEEDICYHAPLNIWRDECQGEGAKKRRWLNVLVYQQVSHLFHSSVSASDDVLFDIEIFETKDMRWAPDGKGFIWLLCCHLYIIYCYFESTLKLVFSEQNNIKTHPGILVTKSTKLESHMVMIINWNTTFVIERWPSRWQTFVSFLNSN